MCGIAGLLGDVSAVNRAAVDRMSAALHHRGPDDAGVWTSEPDAAGRGCILAHRRLSILDLSDAAHQPMTDATTGATLVFGGEIYNYASLRRRLIDAGASFRSTGDTEVLLRHLSAAGVAGLAELRGMFALALWDPRDRSLLLARDHFGMKPLFVCRNPDPSGSWSIAFASEIRALLTSGLMPQRRLRPEAVAAAVWNGFVMGPQTLVEHVDQVSVGSFERYDGRGHQVAADAFWSLTPPDSHSADEAELEAALLESLSLHMVSDVPVGVFLSGGVDSSAVANLTQQATATPIHTFTLAMESPERSEAAAARRIAAAIGTEHQEITLTAAHFTANVESAVAALDQPTFDGLNTYYMSRTVRDAGVTVALVGTGGDELFGGYTSFRRLPALYRWGPPVAPARRSLGSLTRFAPRHLQQPIAKLAVALDHPRDLVRLYQLSYAMFEPDVHAQLLRTPMDGHGLSDSMYGRLAADIRGRTPLSAVGVLEQRCFLGERLLRDSDAASMAVSLELRLPFVDHVVAGVAQRLPDALRFDRVGSKAPLRRIGLRGLPPDLFAGRKRGFELPIDQWLHGPLAGVVGEVLTDRGAVNAAGLDPATVSGLWRAYQSGTTQLYWSRIWSLYVLVRWCRTYGVVMP